MENFPVKLRGIEFFFHAEERNKMDTQKRQQISSFAVWKRPHDFRRRRNLTSHSFLLENEIVVDKKLYGGGWGFELAAFSLSLVNW